MSGPHIPFVSSFNIVKFIYGIFGPFMRQVWKTYKVVVARATGMIAVVAIKVGMKINPELNQEAWKVFFETNLLDDDEWSNIVQAYFEWVTGEQIVFTTRDEMFASAEEALGEKFLNPMLNMVLPSNWQEGTGGAGLTPQDGLDGAERFLGTNMRLQMSGWIVDFVSDMFGIQAARSMGQFVQNLSWSYGLGWLSWLVMGVPFRIAISEPLEKYFQLRFRMKDLSLSQIADFYWQDEAFREEGLQRLKELGYPDDNIPRVLDKARKKLSSGQMTDLVRYAGMTLENVIDEINSTGHDRATATTLGGLLYYEPETKLIEATAKAAEVQYKKGTITETDLMGYLDTAGYTLAEKMLTFQRLNLEKLDPPAAEPKETGLTRAMVGSLYKRGDRDRSWTLLKLTEMNWDPGETADFLLYYQPDEEKEESGKSLTASMIGGLYKRGWIPLLKAEGLWDEIGVRASHIPLYTKYYTRPWDVSPDLPPLKLLSPESVGEMYAAGILSQENAVTMLVEGGLAMHDATLYLALFGTEAEEAEAQQPTLTIWEIAGAVADGLMSLAAGIARLVAAGYSQTAARNYLTLQVAYRVATNVSLACSAGTITHAEALSAMVSAGWSPTDASIYLQQHWCTP